MRKMVWVGSVIIVMFLAYYVIVGLDREMSRYEVIDEEEHRVVSEDIDDIDKKLDTEEILAPVEDGDWELENGENFFVEYRLYRDRVRSKEMETLEELLENPEVSSSSKEDAEKAILKIVDVMEKELLVENMLKALGYEEALFFYRDGTATVMLDTNDLSQEEVLQISEVVGSVTGINREEVKIMVHSS